MPKGVDTGGDEARKVDWSSHMARSTGYISDLHNAQFTGQGMPPRQSEQWYSASPNGGSGPTSHESPPKQPPVGRPPSNPRHGAGDTNQEGGYYEYINSHPRR